MRKVEAWSDKS